MQRVTLLITVVALAISADSLNAQDAGKQLAALLDEHWERGLREHPTFASHLGDLRYNDRWTDVSLAAVERRHKEEIEYLARLRRIDRAELSAVDRVNYDLFEQKLAREIQEFPFGGHLMPMNQMGGVQDENSTADALPFKELKHFEDWLARIERLPTLVEQTMELMKEGIRRGVLPPKHVMRRSLDQVRKQFVDDPEQSLYFKPFKKFPDDVKEADRARVVAAAKKAIADGVVPAYRKLLKFLEDDYIPACYEEIGAWRMTDGTEYYAARARHYTTTALTPDEIHDIGLAEVKRIRAEMEAVMREVGFEGSFGKFAEKLRTDRQFYFESPAELLTAYRDLGERIKPELPKLFRNLPKTPYDIQPVPDNMAPDVPTAYYRPPAADGSRPGTYFVNTYQIESRPKYEMEALSLHEAMPGHHLQIAIAGELTDLPKFRRFGFFTAYVEGWGLYSEGLGPDLGLYQDPYSRFGRLTYEVWRAIRLVVDSGMHHKRWSRQQAIDFFKQNAAKSELDIVNEVDRYIAWPGQALAYKIGELKILELRARAEKQLGEKFDVREFHDVVLRQGAVPLDVLETIVDEWLAGKSG
jgi:prolyl oligopeptidase